MLLPEFTATIDTVVTAAAMASTPTTEEILIPN